MNLALHMCCLPFTLRMYCMHPVHVAEVTVTVFSKCEHMTFVVHDRPGRLPKFDGVNMNL